MSNNLDNYTIYEIFRACRLCGAGGGYKMPIIPSVIGFDCADIELRQKIRECLQIECNQDDKMPPLICELCVDKVNDFYEFLEMCRQTNVKTRQRLGLPLTVPQTASEEDCILGVTEPVYSIESDDEPLTRRSSKLGKVKDEKKKEKNERVKRLQKELDFTVQHDSMTSTRESRSVHRESRDSTSSSGSRRTTRSLASPGKDSDQDNSSISSRFKDQNKKKEFSKPNLKREKEATPIREDDDDSPLLLRSKKPRIENAKWEKELKVELHQDDKVKIDLKVHPTRPASPKPYNKPGPKSKKSLSPPRTDPKPYNKPGPKSKKSLSPPRTDPKPYNKPGPKSKKSLTPPRADPNPSRPGPKSLKRPLTPPRNESKSVPPPPLRTGPKSSRKSLSPPPKPGPKSSKKSLSPPPVARKGKPGPKPARAPSPAKPEYKCGICDLECQAPQGLSSHMRMHLPKFTSPDLACNPCGEWFLTAEELTVHHKWHKKNDIYYSCRACPNQYRQLKSYLQHMAESPYHSPWKEKPDVKCRECWKEFPTKVLLSQHRCLGSDSRPGGKCSKCKKYYHTMKNLKKHESNCTGKKRVNLSDLNIDPAVRRRLLPIEVRTARCDPLLGKRGNRRCNAADVPQDFGLDPTCLYPYKSMVKVKREPMTFDGMVIINKDVRDEFYKEEDYVHWDSDNSSDSEEEYSLINPTQITKKLPSLTALALKTIFSKRCLGKVPRKLRKVKNDKFDSFFNNEQEFDNVEDDINNIIDNLGRDNEDSNSVFDDIVTGSTINNLKDNDRVSALINEENSVLSFDSDSLLDQNKFQGISNNPESNNSADLLKDLTDNINSKFEDNDDGSQTDASSDEGTKVENNINTDNANTSLDNDKVSLGDVIADDNIDNDKTTLDSDKITLDDIITDDNKTSLDDKISLDDVIADDNKTSLDDKISLDDVIADDNTDNDKTSLESGKITLDDIIADSNIDNDKTSLVDDKITLDDIIADNNIDNDKTSLNNDKITLDDILQSNDSVKETLAVEDKVTASENGQACQDFDNIVNSEKQNGVCVADNVNGDVVNSNDLISEINELYDKKLMDELDAQMGI